MPSAHNFHASGREHKMEMDQYDDGEIDEEEEEIRRFEVLALKKINSSKYQNTVNPQYNVSFKEEAPRPQVRKLSSMHPSNVKQQQQQVQNLNTEEDSLGPQQKSRFFRVEGVPLSPKRYQNRHKTLNPPISSMNHNFETYLRNSNLDNSSSVNSTIFPNHSSQRKATLLSSIGQGSSKLRNSQDVSIYIQRTGTLNSRSIKNNGKNQSNRKIPTPVMTHQATLKSSKGESTKKQPPSGTQYAKFENTHVDNQSEKGRFIQQQQAVASSKQEILSLFVIMDFDKLCEFTHYLPQNNLQNVLKQIKKIQKTKQELQANLITKTSRQIKTAKSFKPNGTILKKTGAIDMVQSQAGGSVAQYNTFISPSPSHINNETKQQVNLYPHDANSPELETPVKDSNVIIVQYIK